MKLISTINPLVQKELIVFKSRLTERCENTLTKNKLLI
jgi:hypothetical protein